MTHRLLAPAQRLHATLSRLDGRATVHGHGTWSARNASSSARGGGGGSATADEALRRDFRRWLGREARLVSAMVVLGVLGVKLYQNREGSPSREIARLLDKARANAQNEDREAALQNCLKAYAINKSTNAQDRHLFEMAFLVAAQFETLGNAHQATKFYHEALGSVPYVRDRAEREMSRIVVLDRIAQCYQDQGEHRAAENYYRQAVESYDRSRTSPNSARSAVEEQMDRDIAAVLFNYGQLLMHLKRWNESEKVLKRAQSAAKVSGVSSDDRDRIDRMVAMLQQASVTESEDNEGRE